MDWKARKADGDNNKPTPADFSDGLSPTKTQPSGSFNDSSREKTGRKTTDFTAHLDERTLKSFYAEDAIL
jgi:hypothetical protein